MFSLESVQLPLYLYLLTNPGSNGYNSHSGMVVCAPSEHAARRIHPYCDSGVMWCEEHEHWIQKEHDFGCSAWPEPDQLKVTYLGLADSSVPEGKVLLNEAD